MSTTTLSQRLRELSDEFDLLNTMEDAVRCNPTYQPSIQTAGEQSKRVEALLEKAIAQAQAQEAQAVELSDEVIEVVADFLVEVELPDRPTLVFEQRAYRGSFRKGCVMAMRHARDHYLKPPQAIGEQTPVALNNDQIEQVSSWWQRRGGHDRLAMAHFEAGMREVLASRSPMSSEARDKAIERVEEMLCGISRVNTVYGPSPTHNDAIRAMHEMNAFAIKALSALRGQTSGT